MTTSPLLPSPTHSGGVVVKGRGADLRVLLVTAKRQPSQWVFPKGHIEDGETAEQAGIREVEEEAGVVAEIVAPIGTIQYRNARGEVRAQLYLMTFVSEGEPREDRRRGWFTFCAAPDAAWDKGNRIPPCAMRTGLSPYG